MIVYLASNNPHKATEFAQLLAGADPAIELRSARDLGGMPAVEETAEDFLGNARLKALALAERLPRDGPDCWALADDSGLEVDALDGAPGVRSARFAGEDASDEDNLRHLLRELEGVPEDERGARFRCVLVLRNREGRERIFAGVCEGAITTEPAGQSGFGYDPVFRPRRYDRTFAELGEEVKADLSHRALACQGLLQARME
ncbi:MAG: non-canonical purine NTP pyrophosphatase [Verrucomicrobiota bacterium]